MRESLKGVGVAAVVLLAGVFIAGNMIIAGGCEDSDGTSKDGTDGGGGGATTGYGVDCVDNCGSVCSMPFFMCWATGRCWDGGGCVWGANCTQTCAGTCSGNLFQGCE